jgi:hypothetical protein
MIDMMYIALGDEAIPQIIEKKAEPLEQGGLIHSKMPGRFEEETLKLPKEAKNFDEMFEYADAYGTVRLAYIRGAHKISNILKEEKSASVIGGQFGIRTAAYKGFGLHIATYISQNLGFVNQDKNTLNEDFFNIDKDSFAYLAEADVSYSDERVDAKIGRIKIDTPYANSDDIRMAPNTFEGAWANIKYTESLATQLVHIKKWAGYDSQDDIVFSQDKFKNLVNEESNGMTSASLIYKYDTEGEFSFWYNYIDKMSAISYAEISGRYFLDSDSFHIDYGVQASNLQELENSAIAGNVLGVMALIDYNGLYFGGSYNKAFVKEGNFISNGFGGGPYFTSLDEATIEAISEISRKDSEAFRIGAGYDFVNAGLDGLVAELVYGELYQGENKIIEKDVIAAYEPDDKLKVEVIYTRYCSTDTINDFDRVHMRMDYSF